jgi:hypothetical protein
MSGDQNKILSWAEKAEIEEPEGWFNELYKFLFGNYSGDLKLLKQAAASSFSTFLVQTAENHLNDPKDKWWYTDQGCNHGSFVAALERAAEIENLENAIYYVNARVRDLGFKLYDEYLLAQAGHLDKIKSVASALRKKAYDIEVEVCGEFDTFEPKDVIRHANFPGETFEVQDMVDGVIIVTDKNGGDCYIADVWNVELA